MLLDALQGFPEWAPVMDSWGSKMLDCVETVAQGAAIGFGLEADAFTSRMALGPHLLAPTGTDLAAHGQLGAVMAGFHYVSGCPLCLASQVLLSAYLCSCLIR